MRRRAFITLLGGAAAWPFAARAQQGERMRRIGVLVTLAESDPQGHARVEAFRRGLQELGWSEGHNLRIDYRATGDADRVPTYANELLGLDPDVIFAAAPPAVAALKKATRTVPIVFAQVPDPVQLGLVASMARPGGNITGFTLFEYPIAGKWLELLKQLAPHVAHAVVVYYAASPSWSGYFSAIEAAAPSFRVRITASSARDAAGIEHAMNAAAGAPDAGLIVLPSPLTSAYRALIAELAGRHRLPAVYAYRYFVSSGGLASYGVDNVDLFRRAAGYVDRILKGEKPANLPVQAPTKYELVINLKTARTLGLAVSPTLLARADEVIE